MQLAEERVLQGWEALWRQLHILLQLLGGRERRGRRTEEEVWTAMGIHSITCDDGDGMC